jgi:N-acetylneuraminic acid mutarotase
MNIFKKIILAYLLVFINLSFLQAQGVSWSQKSDFLGSERTWAVSFSIGTKGYVGTGGSNGSYTNDFWEFDPENDIWTQKANVGGSPRGFAVGFSIGDKGYIGLGSRLAEVRNDFWEYDPTTNSWSQKAIFPGQGKVGATAFSIGDKGYVGTGGPSNTIGNETREFWEYNPQTNSWLQKSDFGGAARDRAVGFSIGSKGFIGTGYYYDGSNTVNYNDFWEYNPDTDSWTEKAEYPGGGTHSGAGFALGSNNGYIGMGYLDRTDFWKYDLNSDSWSQILYFEAPGRIALTSCSINGKGYVGLGYRATMSGTIFYNDWWELRDETLSIESVDFISSKIFKVFPNPALDIVNVASERPNIEIKEFIIYDIRGKEQLRTINNSINVSALTSGAYFIKINTSKGVFTKRFIKK